MNSAITIHYIGADWCKTCPVIEPEIVALAKQFAVPFTKNDIKEVEDELLDTITHVPTIRILNATTQKPIVVYDKAQVNSVRAWLTSHVKIASTDDF
jgi:thiol-disulfide isomerase/thioredoxin